MPPTEPHPPTVEPAVCRAAMQDVNLRLGRLEEQQGSLTAEVQQIGRDAAYTAGRIDAALAPAPLLSGRAMAYGGGGGGGLIALVALLRFLGFM